MSGVGVCESCINQEATARCRDCAINFCTNCKMGHLRLPMCKYHQIESIETMPEEVPAMGRLQYDVELIQMCSASKAIAWEQYNLKLNEEQNKVLSQVDESETQYIQEVKRIHSDLRQKVSGTVSAELEKCNAIIAKLTLKDTELKNLLKNTVREVQGNESTSGLKSGELIKSARENAQSIKSDILRYTNAPMKSLVPNLATSQTVSDIPLKDVRVDVAESTDDTSNWAEETIPPVPLHGATAATQACQAPSEFAAVPDAFSPPYLSAEGNLSQNRDVTPVRLQQPNSLEASTVFVDSTTGLGPHIPSAPVLPYYEEATSFPPLSKGNTEVTSASQNARRMGTSPIFLELLNIDYKKSNLHKCEDTVNKIVCINDEIWLVEKNGVVEVLNEHAVPKRTVAIGNYGDYKRIKPKGMAQTKDGKIVVASSKGLYQITDTGAVLVQLSNEAFDDVTVDSANGRHVYALLDRKPAWAVLFEYRDSDDSWHCLKSAELLDTKKLYPKLLVYDQNIYVVKNHFWANNHIFTAYFDVNNLNTSLVFQPVKKDVFKDNPRLCCVDRAGCLLIGEWGEHCIRIYKDATYIKQLRVEDCVTYFRDAAVLKSGNLMIASDTYPSKVYLLEARS